MNVSESSQLPTTVAVFDGSPLATEAAVVVPAFLSPSDFDCPEPTERPAKRMMVTTPPIVVLRRDEGSGNEESARRVFTGGAECTRCATRLARAFFGTSASDAT